MITRHFIDVGTGDEARRVHYRRAGKGPPLLMVHQSPRSSADYIELMETWGAHFTCIAPDSPGFGQSEPLSDDADIDDFAQATVAFLDALGIKKTAAYGYHSGAMILMAAVRKHTHRFTTFAAGGYAIWSAEEMEVFGNRYLPPFRPSAYGEHLTWLWNRVLEQTWFFPWFKTGNDSRLRIAHDDPERVDTTVQDLLQSGDAYRVGYGAVLTASRDIPAPDADVPPTLITADDNDPLQPHIDRLENMPPNWRAEKVPTPQVQQDMSLAHLLATPTPDLPELPECADEGFVHVETAGFSGALYWHGARDAKVLVIHAPGRAASLLEADAGGQPALLIDMPGHGLSADWGRAQGLDEWAEIAAAAAKALGMAPEIVVGEGASYLLTPALARLVGAPGIGGFNVAIPTDREQFAKRALPSVAPDRHGLYLTRAWNIVRSAHMFFPWYAAGPQFEVPIDEDALAPDALAAEHLAMMRARRGPQFLRALLEDGPDNIMRGAPRTLFMRKMPWADARKDIWTPEGD